MAAQRRQERRERAAPKRWPDSTDRAAEPSETTRARREPSAEREQQMIEWAARSNEKHETREQRICNGRDGCCGASFSEHSEGNVAHSSRVAAQYEATANDTRIARGALDDEAMEGRNATHSQKFNAPTKMDQSSQMGSAQAHHFLGLCSSKSTAYLRWSSRTRTVCERKFDFTEFVMGRSRGIATRMRSDGAHASGSSAAVRNPVADASLCCI